ncbi:MAG: type I-C CRISPR-associated protein Cas8c/Csd1, partial [Burkholderiaceae bacterium]|nr:type I-C CRISPR-associated protein Cas8c/Csd1 [Burkholderiaceae bacterium]
MILQALVDYYNRRVASTDTSRRLPAYGLEDKAIPFVIVLDADGRVVQLRDTRQPDGKQLRAQRFLVPQGEKKTSGVKANLLWDSAEYVIGLPRERKTGGDETPAAAYRRRIESLPAEARADAGVVAVLRALDRADWSVLRQHPAWGEIEQANPVMTFALASDAGALVCQRPEVVRAALEPASPEATGLCLVDGRHGAISRLHPSIKGVADEKGRGGPGDIVSFNARAYESFGKTKKQGENAPIGERATFAYITALNALLDPKSPNRALIADATTVFWADRDTGADAEFAALFGGDDPDVHVNAVRRRLEGIRAGALGVVDSKTNFFVLGLSRRKARIAVRFWMHEPYERLAPRVLQHFDDLRIARAEHEPATPSMNRLLTAIAPQGKADNIPPRLAGEWMRAILEGTPYPPALLNAAVNRCRAEQAKKDDRTGKPVPNVPYLRAAILRACINRERRRRQGVPADFQFIPEDLDVNQTDPAYRLGRLFAVLERIQSRAQQDINATIRDRYYGAASSTPSVVFPTLMRLKNAHLKKLSDGEA